MKRIIAIWGHGGCGKTTCINYIRELLRSNGVSISPNAPCKGDKCEAFRYKDIVVCVCPGGDTLEIIKSNFTYALSMNADVVITACRSKGSPKDVVREYAKMFGITVKWSKKSVEYKLSEETQDLCNREYAQVIFDLL